MELDEALEKLYAISDPASSSITPTMKEAINLVLEELENRISKKDLKQSVDHLLNRKPNITKRRCADCGAFNCIGDNDD